MEQCHRTAVFMINNSELYTQDYFRQTGIVCTVIMCIDTVVISIQPSVETAVGNVDYLP
jgi:hypothetical protein